MWSYLALLKKNAIHVTVFLSEELQRGSVVCNDLCYNYSELAYLRYWRMICIFPVQYTWTTWDENSEEDRTCVFWLQVYLREAMWSPKYLWVTDRESTYLRYLRMTCQWVIVVYLKYLRWKHPRNHYIWIFFDCMYTMNKGYRFTEWLICKQIHAQTTEWR